MKELSEGAFGKVYLAEMITGENFKSIVAIKLLHGKWSEHEEIVQRSRDEARVLGLLHHRNIIRVEDLTSINGQCAIVMEYLDGVDIKKLTSWSKEHGSHIPRKVAFEITAQIASALEAAYSETPLASTEPLHLIHRDIKPSNVMVTVAGDIKVLDFGTAQASFDHREAHTQALAFGSAAYMAPERLLGDPDAPSGDVFSLGITLYEMLTNKGFGKVHIRPAKFDEKLDARMAAMPLDDLDPERQDQVRTTLKLMMAYDATDRPSAGQVVDLMEALAEEVHDGSLRKFCREVVHACRASITRPQDVNDPLTGSTLFEDSSNLVSPDLSGPQHTWIDEPIDDEPVDDEPSPFTVPPELQQPPQVQQTSAPQFIDAPVKSTPAGDPHVDSDMLPTVSIMDGPVVELAPPPSPAERAAMPVEDVPPALSSPIVENEPPVHDPVSAGAPQSLPVTAPEPPAPEPPAALEPPASAEPVPEPSPEPVPEAPPEPVAAPTPEPSVSPDPPVAPELAAEVDPGDALQPITIEIEAEQPEEPAPPRKKGGGLLKLMLVGILFLGVVVVVGGVWVFKGLGADTPAPQETPHADGVVSGGVVQGSASGPEAATIKLSLSRDGAAQVSITAATADFKQGWDGSGELELHNIKAGTYRTKIAVPGQTTVRTILEVAAGQTCSYRFDLEDSREWHQTACE